MAITWPTSWRIPASIVWALLHSMPLTGSPAQKPGTTIKRLEIESSAWNGKKVIRQKLSIHAAGVRYTANGREISSDSLNQLIEALTSPPLPLSPKALGLDWRRLTPNLYPNETSLIDAVELYYNQTVFLDDDAEFRLDVTLVSGISIRLYSRQSQAFMLPWQVLSANHEFQTYDVRISNAVLRLLPDGFLNRSRIAGCPHGTDLVHEIGTTAATPADR